MARLFLGGLCPVASGILVSQPGIKSMPLVLGWGLPTTRLPGKPPKPNCLRLPWIFLFHCWLSKRPGSDPVPHLCACSSWRGQMSLEQHLGWVTLWPPLLVPTLHTPTNFGLGPWGSQMVADWPDISICESHDFSERLRKLLKIAVGYWHPEMTAGQWKTTDTGCVGFTSPSPTHEVCCRGTIQRSYKQARVQTRSCRAL